MTWKHFPQKMYRRGKVMIVCCSKQSGWQDTIEEAYAWYHDHTGLREKKNKEAH